MHQDSKIKWLLYNLLSVIPDKLYLTIKYYKNFGRLINWKNPKSFNEKINWLKIYDRNPSYVNMVDKYEVKDYVAGIIGQQYIIPTLGVWDRAEDIDFDSLPNQFVLKATHDSGRIIICKDKRNFDQNNAIKEMKKSLQRNFYAVTREWPYKMVKRRIIAEKYMESKANDAPKDLPDYKFYCFSGEPIYCQVIRDRSTLETIDFYDMNWNHQNFIGLNPNAIYGTIPVDKPKCLPNMIEICKKLSNNIPFVRVDLYVIDDNEYFGELTFYPASGNGKFSPKEWMIKLGEMISLPKRGGGVICRYNNNSLELKFLKDNDDLKDYKFFCFNGKVKLFKVDFCRFTNHQANYYDRQGNLLRFGEKVCPPNFNHIETLPDNIDEMIAIAESLSKCSRFLRVDLYNIKGKIYFGELTFYPASGMGPFIPNDYDEILGKLLVL